MKTAGNDAGYRQGTGNEINSTEMEKLLTDLMDSYSDISKYKNALY